MNAIRNYRCLLLIVFNIVVLTLFLLIFTQYYNKPNFELNKRLETTITEYIDFIISQEGDSFFKSHNIQVFFSIEFEKSYDKIEISWVSFKPSIDEIPSAFIEIKGVPVFLFTNSERLFYDVNLKKELTKRKLIGGIPTIEDPETWTLYLCKVSEKYYISKSFDTIQFKEIELLCE
jgi:hypothetical protein